MVERQTDMRRWVWIIILVGCGLLATTLAGFADDKEQRKVAYTFLTAYARNENEKIRPYLVDDDANQFGPFPFTEAPTLKRAKVDDNQAIVEFTAKVKDEKYPVKGGVLCKRHEGTWLVRQVLFYEKVPGIFKLPSKSVTDDDRAEEPAVNAVAAAFVKAWQRNDLKTMMDMRHHWAERESDPIKGLSIANFDCDILQTKWGESFVKYKSKLTYKWGILSYSMNFTGGMVMVKEDGKWKVRANVMVLYFDD